MKHPCIRLMVAALAACLVLLSGCELATSSADGALTGYWKSTFGDGFDLSGNTLEGFRYVQYDDADRNVSFAGIVANRPNFDASTGYIIVLVTEPGSWGKTADSYYAIHWKNLSGSLVAAASAYKVGGAHNNGMETLAEALAEYTVENGYYGYYGEYEKQ
ncbi:MAG TPA: hypothetical protein PLU76_05880 [Treponemataceae bacterium]|nr:hypothetical protein [Treponemataceae bacterium]